MFRRASPPAAANIIPCRQLEEQLRAVMEHRDMLLQTMESAVGDAPALKQAYESTLRSVPAYGDPAPSRTREAGGAGLPQRARYDPSGVVSAFDVGA